MLSKVPGTSTAGWGCAADGWQDQSLAPGGATSMTSATATGAPLSAVTSAAPRATTARRSFPGRTRTSSARDPVLRTAGVRRGWNFATGQAATLRRVGPKYQDRDRSGKSTPGRRLTDGPPPAAAAGQRQEHRVGAVLVRLQLAELAALHAGNSG